MLVLEEIATRRRFLLEDGVEWTASESTSVDIPLRDALDLDYSLSGRGHDWSVRLTNHATGEDGIHDHMLQAVLRVNGAPVRESRLRAGDTIRFTEHDWRVTFDDETEPLASAAVIPMEGGGTFDALLWAFTDRTRPTNGLILLRFAHHEPRQLSLRAAFRAGLADSLRAFRYVSATGIAALGVIRPGDREDVRKLLRPVCSDEDTVVRRAAIAGACRLDPLKWTSALRAELAESMREGQGALPLINAIASFTSGADDAQRSSLALDAEALATDGTPEQRSSAAVVLGWLATRDGSLLRVLSRLSADPDVVVRGSVSLGLTWSRSEPESQRLLFNLLADKTNNVRSGARIALFEGRRPVPAERLLEAIANAPAGDPRVAWWSSAHEDLSST